MVQGGRGNKNNGEIGPYKKPSMIPYRRDFWRTNLPTWKSSDGVNDDLDFTYLEHHVNVYQMNCVYLMKNLEIYHLLWKQLVFLF